MRSREAFLLGVATVASLLCTGQARAQSSPKANAPVSVRTISVTGSRPVAAAMDVIEARYGVAIDYSDPVYTSTADTQLLYTFHCALCAVAKPGEKTTGSKPPVLGPHDIHLLSPMLIPRVRAISVQYTEEAETPRGIPYLSCKVATPTCKPVNVWPEHGITALIGEVLSDLATQGGQVFRVQKVTLPYGPRWEVYPVKARNAVGSFVPQPDFLGVVLHVPAAHRGLLQMLDLIAQQLTRRWGRQFQVAFTDGLLWSVGPAPPHGEYGAEGVTARQALLSLLGPGAVLRVREGVDEHGNFGDFGINIVPLPYREPPRPPTPAPVPARVLPPRRIPAIDWVFASNTPQGKLEVQAALAKAGYLLIAPTTKWDANSIAALRRFQAANGLPATGSFDGPTAHKLLPFLPDAPARVLPAKPAMDLALAYWLGSTPDGRKEIEQALTKAGFYHGSITGTTNNPAAKQALKAFQKANGLPPNGWFTYETAEKLAPFLPQPDK